MVRYVLLENAIGMYYSAVDNDTKYLDATILITHTVRKEDKKGSSLSPIVHRLHCHSMTPPFCLVYFHIRFKTRQIDNII